MSECETLVPDVVRVSGLGFRVCEIVMEMLLYDCTGEVSWDDIHGSDCIGRARTNNMMTSWHVHIYLN